MLACLAAVSFSDHEAVEHHQWHCYCCINCRTWGDFPEPRRKIAQSLRQAPIQALPKAVGVSFFGATSAAATLPSFCCGFLFLPVSILNVHCTIPPTCSNCNMTVDNYQAETSPTVSFSQPLPPHKDAPPVLDIPKPAAFLCCSGKQRAYPIVQATDKNSCACSST